MKKIKRFLWVLHRMFYWCGIWLFDSRLKEYDGFNHFLAGRIFRWRYNSIEIELRWQCKFERRHEDKEFWYDGYWNYIDIGFIHIGYTTA